MRKKRNLAELTKEISKRLLTSKYLIEILSEISQHDGKTSLLFKQLKREIILSFNEVEECRNKIYILD